jgi:hypothetical protein
VSSVSILRRGSHLVRNPSANAIKRHRSEHRNPRRPPGRSSSIDRSRNGINRSPPATFPVNRRS